jgi:cobyrinic acid a,c-diamide synthase
MYLMKSIQDLEGRVFPMADIFPFRSRMQERLKALGYREVTIREDSLLGPAGTRVRGHEFHYSSIVSAEGEVPFLYGLSDRSGNLEREEGYRCDNVLGSYIHLHFGSNPDAAAHLVRFCRQRDLS